MHTVQCGVTERHIRNGVAEGGVNYAQWSIIIAFVNVVVKSALRSTPPGCVSQKFLHLASKH